VSTKFRTFIRAQGKALLREHSTPMRVGVAVFVGVLVGCSPFLALQTLIALAIAWACRLNKVAVLLGLQISVPPITPLVLFAGAQLGERVLHGRWLPMTLRAFRDEPTRELAQKLFFDLLVGGALLGGVLGIILGAAAAQFVASRREPRRAGATDAQ
jgi:uncharacterized protein (DUF2062 family)